MKNLNDWVKEWQAMGDDGHGVVAVDRFMDELDATFHQDPVYQRHLGHIDSRDHSKYRIMNADQVFHLISQQTELEMRTRDYDERESLYYANLLSDWYNQSNNLDRREWNMVYWDGNGVIVGILPLQAKDVTALLYRLSVN